MQIYIYKYENIALALLEDACGFPAFRSMNFLVLLGSEKHTNHPHFFDLVLITCIQLVIPERTYKKLLDAKCHSQIANKKQPENH